MKPSCCATLLVLSAISGTTWSKRYYGSQAATEPAVIIPEGAQDGPCSNVGFKGSVDWKRMLGTWNENLRMISDFQPTQCPSTTTYSGISPNITGTVVATLPDGSMAMFSAQGIIQSDPNLRLVPDPPVSGPGFPNPEGIVFETIYTDYSNIHVFWTCYPLPGNKNIHYAWIDSRQSVLPEKTLKYIVKKLEKLGVDVARFRKVGPCT